MALSLSKSKLFSLSLSLTRRGYAVAAVDGSAVVGLGRGGSMGSMVGKAEERRLMMNGSDSEASNAWAPHPLTGYYRPANHADEIDPVELRQMLLNNKVKNLRTDGRQMMEGNRTATTTGGVSLDEYGVCAEFLHYHDDQSIDLM